MNSLYGKFAQKIDTEHIYIEDVEKQIHVIQEYERQGKIIKIVPFNSERNDCFLVVGNENDWTKSFCIPSFASYITSYCRVHLLKKMLQIGEKNLLYCDTDSAFFSGNNKFKDETFLGGWKLEGKRIKAVYGLKNYEFEYIDKKTGKKIRKHRIKGIPERAVEIAKHTYQYVNLVKTKESLRRGIASGSEVERTKIVKNTYTKRIVNKDGTTKPIKF